jgi:hypothetical protein
VRPAGCGVLPALTGFALTATNNAEPSAYAANSGTGKMSESGRERPKFPIQQLLPVFSG